MWAIKMDHKILQIAIMFTSFPEQQTIETLKSDSRDARAFPYAQRLDIKISDISLDDGTPRLTDR